MKYEIDGCVGCDMKPCYSCTEIAYECDYCHEDMLRGDDVMCADILPNERGHMCVDCFKEYIVGSFDVITDMFPEATKDRTEEDVEDIFSDIWVSV